MKFANKLRVMVWTGVWETKIIYYY